jgi:transposase InsO family protein
VTFRFIEAEKAIFPVRALCRALEVSPSGYYAWQSRGPSPRACTDVGVRHAMRVAYAESRGRYGSPRLHQAVRARGFTVGRNRVIRLMRADGLQARHRRRFRVTTDSAHSHRIARNLVRRRFRPTRPNVIWAADVTALPTATGWAYLAVVLDLYSRAVVGWAVRPTFQTELPLAALHLALGRRQPPRGLVHHSDRGVQYASGDYQRVLAAHGLVPSMSRRGDCWDNAVVESFFSTLKHELDATTWANEPAAAHAIGEYIDRFYNPQRLHSTLGYQSPAAFEARAVM